jgi:hypothetical protein
MRFFLESETRKMEMPNRLNYKIWIISTRDENIKRGDDDDRVVNE